VLETTGECGGNEREAVWAGDVKCFSTLELVGAVLKTMSETDKKSSTRTYRPPVKEVLYKQFRDWNLWIESAFHVTRRNNGTADFCQYTKPSQYVLDLVLKKNTPSRA